MIEWALAAALLVGTFWWRKRRTSRIRREGRVALQTVRRIYEARLGGLQVRQTAEAKDLSETGQVNLQKAIRTEEAALRALGALEARAYGQCFGGTSGEGLDQQGFLPPRESP